ncbi:MAG: GNAT family N-acetyltransferase [Oscillospiraceae bacterium]|nr:GNAT family N-acetyltransferase [Oscillospiraceae bacterium]
MNTTTRNPEQSDLPYLRQIWKEAFGSDDDDLFFDYCYCPDKCVITEINRTPIAMGFILPAGTLVGSGGAIPCAMIYALATMPEHRKRGYGSQIVQELVSASRAAGYPITVLCPSNEENFRYYAENTQFRDAFYICEKSYHDLPPCPDNAAATIISANEYENLRKPLLKGLPHIEMGSRAIEYQERLCKLTGGALVRVDVRFGTSIAAIELAPEAPVLIKELLLPLQGSENQDTATHATLAAIAKIFPANEYIVRTPIQDKENDSSHIRRFGMIDAPQPVHEALSGQDAAPWYGFAFD